MSACSSRLGGSGPAVASVARAWRNAAVVIDSWQPAVTTLATVYACALVATVTTATTVLHRMWRL